MEEQMQTGELAEQISEALEQEARRYPGWLGNEVV